MIFEHPGLIYAFSKRPANMSLVYGQTKEVLANRRCFLSGLGIDYRHLICGQQGHTSQVRQVKEEDQGRGAFSYTRAFASTDALITNEKSLPLAVFTADCLSVFLYDPCTVSIGLVHAGWRGTCKQIVVKTMQLMQKKFNCRPQDLYVGFGPAIRDCCYEVGSEFRSFFNYGLKFRKGRYYLDLVGIHRKQLQDVGISQAHISDPCLCTFCRNKEFFSYRKEGSSCGRMISVIMLK